MFIHVFLLAFSAEKHLLHKKRAEFRKGAFRHTVTTKKKKPIFDLVRSIACLVLIETLWNLQITWTGIKSWMCLNPGMIRLFILELLSLECQKPRFCPKCSLCNFYPIFMKLADKKDRCKIFNKLDWATLLIYFGVTCPWLLACWVSGEWLLPSWATCLL